MAVWVPFAVRGPRPADGAAEREAEEWPSQDGEPRGAHENPKAPAPVVAGSGPALVDGGCRYFVGEA